MLAYRHSSGLLDWLLGILVRGATYRVLGTLPLGLVVGVGLVALVVLVARRRGRTS